MALTGIRSLSAGLDKSSIIRYNACCMAMFAELNGGQFQVGDLVRVHIQDASARRREAIFEGYVLGIRGEGEGKSFVVRRTGAGGIGVEKIFPLFSPLITKIEVKQKLGEGVRRAKLYYLREKGKSALDAIRRQAARKGKVATKSKSKQSLSLRGKKGSKGSKSRKK